VDQFEIVCETHVAQWWPILTSRMAEHRTPFVVESPFSFTALPSGGKQNHVWLQMVDETWGVFLFWNILNSFRVIINVITVIWNGSILSGRTCTSVSELKWICCTKSGSEGSLKMRADMFVSTSWCHNRENLTIRLWDVEAPTFCLYNGLTDGGEVVSFTHWPPFTPQEDSWYSFLLEAESTPGA
jgi:hypothetical protein